MLTHDARRLAVIAVLPLLLAGCTKAMAGTPIGTGQIVDSNPTESPPTAGSGQSGPPPTPTIPSWPQAQDGTDISACYDGTCEVELRAPVTIPMDPATGIASLTLNRVDDVDGAQLSGTDVNGGTFEASLYVDPGGGTATTNLNGFTIVALATANGRAVLRMSPA